MENVLETPEFAVKLPSSITPKIVLAVLEGAILDVD